MKAYKNKILIQNTVTYAMVIACYVLIQALMAAGHVNSLVKGLLVPLCMYVILAVSLNLTEPGPCGLYVRRRVFRRVF